MPGFEISEELLGEINRLLDLRQAGNANASLDAGRLSEKDRETVRLLSQAIGSVRPDDTISAYKKEVEITKSIFENMLYGLDICICVTVPNTGEILFLNDKLRKVFGIDIDPVGHRCYKLLMGLDERCGYCPYHRLEIEPDKAIVWEDREAGGQIFRKTARLIDWIGGVKAHLEYGVDITAIRKAHAALEERTNILDTINRAALILLRQEKKSFSAAMNESFGLIAVMANIDRMSVFRNSDRREDGLHLSQIYRWRKDAGGTIPILDNLADTTYDSFVPRWENILAAGNPVCGLTHLMPEADLLARYGSVSVLAVPVFNDGVFWGFVLYERFVEEKFTEFETDILRSASFMLANAVIRNEESAIIRNAEERTRTMLETQAHWYKSILDATPLPISVTDKDRNWTFVNTAVEKFLQLKNEDIIGKPCSNWNAQICGTEHCGIACVERGTTQTFFRQDASSYQVDVGILKNLRGEPAGFVEVVQNITEVENMARKQMDLEESISHLEAEVEKNYYDPLTSIYNRRYFEEKIEPLMRTLSRAGGTLSIMMVDIDCFKQFNDTYGHIEGDECLKAVANTLQQSTMRKEDFVARYGGEEFVVVLPNTGEAGARKIADKMLTGIWERDIPNPQSTADERVTVSIGIVSGKVTHTHKRDDYLKRADEMLYKSKQDGRNRYSYTGFEPG